jgi:hypothetical protein
VHQAIGGTKYKGKRKHFFPNLAPKLFNFFNERFFPGLFNNTAFCLTPLALECISFSVVLWAPAAAEKV